MKPRDYYEPRNIPTASFVAQMKKVFPRYSAAANSLCNHSEQTGVCLTSKAQSVLKASRVEKRTRPCKFTFRLLESTGELLRAFAEDEGISIQTVVETAIIRYLDVVAGGVRDNPELFGSNELLEADI